MKPKRYPYLGKLRIVKKDLPRFVRLGDIAFNKDLVKYIQVIRQVAPNQTLICFKLPKPFLAYEETQVRVNLKIEKVVNIFNQS